MSFKGKYGGTGASSTSVSVPLSIGAGVGGGSGSPRRLSQPLAGSPLSPSMQLPCGGSPASGRSSRIHSARPAPLVALDLEPSSTVTPSRQRTLAFHGSPVASALKSRKRSNFSTLLSGGRGVAYAGGDRLLDSGTKFPPLLDSAADYSKALGCSEAMGVEEARLDPSHTVVLQCEYSFQGGDAAVAGYTKEDPLEERIAAQLAVISHQIVDAYEEVGRYATVPSEADDDDGACGCSEEEITRNDRGMDYSRFHTHALFKECYVCKRQPAHFLCLTSLKAVCASHVEEHYKLNPRCSLFINMLDIATSYDRTFWCERCSRFTWKYTDVYENLTEQLMYTRGGYWGSALRDITATAYHARCGPSSSRSSAPPTDPSSHTHTAPDAHDKSGGDGYHLCAVAATAQGWRVTQEDAEAVFLLRVPSFGPSSAGTAPKEAGRVDHMCVFAVFDGHGGDAVARLAATRIEGFLQAQLLAMAKEKRPPIGDELDSIRAFYLEVFEEALLALDADIRAGAEGRRGDYNLVGSTACIVGVTNSYIVCANVGDSGAALYSRHDDAIVQLSHTHRLEDALETSRVRAAGYAIRQGRIEGLLAVPRALGDFEFKQTRGGPKEQAVISCPTVKAIRTPPSFSNRQLDDGSTPIPWGLLIACDGVWDTLSIQQVSKVTSTYSSSAAALVHEACEKGTVPPCLPEQLLPNLLRVFGQCIAPTNNDEGVGVDNVSAIFVEPCPMAPRKLSGTCLADEDFSLLAPLVVQ